MPIARNPPGVGRTILMGIGIRGEGMQRCAVYARVSTANNGQDPTMQTRELREYCERRGWTIAGEYVDTGISGAQDRRPELDRLKNACWRRFDPKRQCSRRCPVKRNGIFLKTPPPTK